MKIGDIITCINKEWKYHELTSNKNYKILKIQDDMILIKNNNNEIGWYFNWRFITLKQNRKLKLINLKS